MCEGVRVCEKGRYSVVCEGVRVCEKGRRYIGEVQCYILISLCSSKPAHL